MSSNIIDPLPKKSDNPSITVWKTSGDIYETEKSLVATAYTVFKEGNTDMGKKPNLVKEDITHPISKNNIDIFKNIYISQASNKTVDKSSINKSDKGKSLDESRSNQKTDT